MKTLKNRDGPDFPAVKTDAEVRETTDLDSLLAGRFDVGQISNNALEPDFISPYQVKKLQDLDQFGHFHTTYGSAVKRQFRISEEVDNWSYPYIHNSEAANFNKDPWHYHVNRYGFRDVWKEHPKRANIGFYGCSFTYGEGIESSKLWVDLVAKKFNLNKFNFGIGGASPLRIARTFIATQQVLNFSYAIILLPSMHRIDYAQVFDKENSDKSRPFDFLPNEHFGKAITNDKTLAERWKTFYKTYDSNNFILNLIYAVSLITESARANNVKLVFATWCPETLYTLHKIGTINLFPNQAMKGKGEYDYARDDMHPGPITNSEFAQELTDWINIRAL